MPKITPSQNKEMLETFLEVFLGTQDIDVDDDIYFNGYLFKNAIHRKFSIQKINEMLTSYFIEMGYTPEASKWLCKNYFANKDPSLSFNPNSNLIYGSLNGNTIPQ